MPILEALFGRTTTPAERLRQHLRSLQRARKDLERERSKLEGQEKSLVADIKRNARQGQLAACKVMARDLVRTRQNIHKFYQMSTQLQAVALRMQTLRSTQQMAEAMRGASKALGSMNRSMNIMAMQRILQEFERESGAMDMKDEILNDTIEDSMGNAEDDAMGEGIGEGEQSDAILREVLDEIGIDVSQKAAESGRVAVGESVGAPAAAQQSVASTAKANDDAALQERLDKLRKIDDAGRAGRTSEHINALEVDARQLSRSVSSHGRASIAPRRRAAAFFALGLLNNMFYVIILTAALELLPPHGSTGLVAFANIAPALAAKAIYPYWLSGEIHYKARVIGCTALATCGMLTIALFTALIPRLVGIGIASFASGLGEITILQYTTRYPYQVTTDSVGWFASGTGAAGLVGALAWWLVRPLGVSRGLGILVVFPSGLTAAFLALPSATAGAEYEALSGEERLSRDGVFPRDAEPLFEGGPALRGESAAQNPSRPFALSFAHKMRLFKPMLLPYVLPLVTVYFAEYTINQGISPTLLYPVPDASKHPLLAAVIHTLRDYYPLYQLTYQAFVFLSRSYTSLLRLPPIPRRWLWMPAIVQGCILFLLTSESIYAWFRESIARSLVIVFVAIEGLAGGAA
ncbi:battenin CLN3 protein [Malassezia sp. CBS 17886]|nr:battenin CLN3 protein [Malassezia sp. CBS 17886]